MERSRTKILYVITKSVWGGAQRYVYDLATHLPRNEFEVSVATGGSGSLIDKLSAAGIPVFRVPSLERNFRLFRDLTSFMALLKLFAREKPDIIHLNSPKAGAVGGATAFLFKRLATGWRPLIVYTVHGWAFQEDRNAASRGLIYLASWFSSLFHDLVVTINRTDLRLAQRFIPERKLAFVPNGIPPIDFLPREEARKILTERTGQMLPPDPFLIGTVAELTPNKGLSYLIQAIAELPPELKSRTRTFLIGDGEDRQKLEREIRIRNCESQVHLLGFLPEANRLLKAFDVFVLPSVKEGLPYALMEAMSAGLPAVASYVGGIPDLILDGETGFLAPARDKRALRTHLEALWKDHTAQQELGARARQRIDETFQLRDMIENMILLYREHLPTPIHAD